jgi:hypothetical protein
LAKKSYNGYASFVADYYSKPAAPNKSTINRDTDRSKYQEPRTAMFDEAVKLSVTHESIRNLKTRIQRNRTSDTFELLAQDRTDNSHLAFWQLNDNKTAVMVLNTFGPAEYVAATNKSTLTNQ